MEQASWRSKLIAAGLGIAIPLLWILAQVATITCLELGNFQWFTIFFGVHWSGLLLLLAIMPLYNKLPRKIKIGTFFRKRSILPIISVFIIYLAFNIYGLLSGTHQEIGVKLLIQTPWPYVFPVFLTALVLTPLGEEILFRGYIANAFPLEKKWGMIASALVTTALFSCIHFQYEHLVSFLEIAALGFVFIWARIHSGGLGLPIFLHFLASVLNIISGLLLP